MEIGRHALTLSGQPPKSHVEFDHWPSELVLFRQAGSNQVQELVRQKVDTPEFEAEALARPDDPVHPVDLGTILVPSDWLLLEGQQSGTIRFAALCRRPGLSRVLLKAWFASVPESISSVELLLVTDQRAEATLPLPVPSAVGDRDVLHVSVESTSGDRLWQKEIPTMIVRQRPAWARFGAAQTKLRYDAPISVRAGDGSLSSIPFEQGWREQLQDVVVSLPNGTRFVFWRGSSYVPFWAGRSNNCLSYEWAETSPPADGFEDCVEPLMDKELRYGRVQIVESTPARVHVRWSYQSCDFKYKVWGDSAVEDFYFYPDGFGTRVLTIQSVPEGDYELSEFIILTPQSTYPFSVLPPEMVDILFLDGTKRQIVFPFNPAAQGEKMKSSGVPALYRVRLHNDEPQAAIYFNPLDIQLPPAVFGPFYDQGVLVTPHYWGSHWPLARGKTTGWSIDNRINLTPCHNSVMSWARSRPAPLRLARLETIDTLGKSKSMVVQTWAWLIGMTDANDERLLEWAQSFAKPPSLELSGARLGAQPYVPERRAICLQAESKNVAITLKPSTPCVNPVFEFSPTPGKLVRVALSDRDLEPDCFAWDGSTLWLDETFREPTGIEAGVRGLGRVPEDDLGFSPPAACEATCALSTLRIRRIARSLYYELSRSSRTVRCGCFS